jgi:hypothetical protein
MWDIKPDADDKWVETPQSRPPDYTEKRNFQVLTVPDLRRPDRKVRVLVHRVGNPGAGDPGDWIEFNRWHWDESYLLLEGRTVGTWESGNTTGVRSSRLAGFNKVRVLSTPVQGSPPDMEIPVNPDATDVVEET